MTDSNNKPIGGYHELALPYYSKPELDGFIKTNSARSALKLVFNSIPISKVWLPFYICDSVVDSAKECSLDFSFYSLDQDLNIPTNLSLENNEFILCTDYFGVSESTINNAIATYGHDKVIADNSQAFFSAIPKCLATILSPRKFFGLPDGGLLYSEDSKIKQPETRDESSENRTTHLISRLTNGPEVGYKKYLEAEESISRMPILGMSALTERLMHSVDCAAVQKTRNQNAQRLHEQLKDHTRLPVNLSHSVAPLCYPFLPKRNEVTRNELIEKRIFVPCYWPEALDRVEKHSFELDLINNGLFLPCDQRCTSEDMDYIVSALDLQ